MKHKLITTLILGFTLVSSAAIHEESLPESWYQLPEDHPQVTRMSERDERAQEARAARGVERILKASSEALDGVTDANARKTYGVADWKFAALMLDLSVSASGLVGAMMAKGEASAQLYWRPKSKRTEANFPSDDEADLVVRGDWTRAELSKQLEPMIRAVMATKEVKDEPALRRNLLDMVMGYQHLIQYLAFDPGREWYVSRLRLDVSVDISGRVQPTITVGGAVRLRFEWEPSAYSRQTVVADSKSAENLRRFVSTIGHDLRGLPLETMAPAGFNLKSLKFGLGIFGEGKFGVVKAGASVMGHLYLTHKAVTHPVFIPESEFDESIALIDDSAEEKHLDYARSIGVNYSVLSTRNGDRRVKYDIPREAFKKGLEKAGKMGAWMAERASRSDGQSWELYQLKTEFALSLSGTVEIITLGGTAALELVFQK